jgi:hypothetical protein
MFEILRFLFKGRILVFLVGLALYFCLLRPWVMSTYRWMRP